jgi:DNA-directed RNA polymerase subunit RPC12/RpoP
LGLVLFSLPWFAVSLYLLLSSRGEIKEETKADKERTILSAVMTRGRVSVADLAIECDLTREQVRDYVYDIIGKDLFRGYVNWEKGELVSAEAAHIKSDTCPNCGGKVELAGKGLVRCPFCGTETYLSAPTSGVKAVHAKEPVAVPDPAATEEGEAPPGTG